MTMIHELGKALVDVCERADPGDLPAQEAALIYALAEVIRVQLPSWATCRPIFTSTVSLTTSLTGSRKPMLKRHKPNCRPGAPTSDRHFNRRNDDGR